MALARFRSKFGVQVSDSNSASGYDLLPVGTIMYWAGPTASAPAGWLACDGSPISRSVYSNLHAVMALAGYPYGNGDGSTTFNLPDARGRALRHGTSPVTSGAENYTLLDADIVAHTHTVDHSHGLAAHTHGATTHGHPVPTHNHGAINHAHGNNSGGDHTHAYFIQSNNNPGTAFLRISTTPASVYTVHATGGGNHDHNFASSDGASTVTTGGYVGGFLVGLTNTATTATANSNTGDANSTVTTQNGGGSRTSISLMQPFVVLNIIIKA